MYITSMGKIHAIKIALATTLLLLALFDSNAQENNNRTISIKTINGSVLQVLDQINDLDDISLSYDPGIIPNDTIESMEYEDIPIDNLLKDLLGDGFNIKFVGDHIIIQKQQSANEEALLPVQQTIELAVIPVKDSVIVNDIVAPQLPLVKPEPIDSSGYMMESTAESLNESTEINHGEENDISSRMFQVSLLPGISTSGMNSKKVSVGGSLNLIAGYQYGVDAVEIGMIYNRQHQYLHGFQLAGVVNQVGASVKGVQVAGALNLNGGSMYGIQTTLGANINMGNVAGIQGAMVFNVAQDSLNGMQVALGSNVSSGTTSGAQIAMGANISTDTLKGVQLAGVGNYAKHLKGFQGAIGINLSQHGSGVQIGAINKSKKFKGMQIGLINMIDSLDKGITLGFLNFVKNGKLELGAERNDVEDLRISFRNGAHAFYNIYSVGIRLKEQQIPFLWSLGLGFGTQKNFNDNLYTNLEISTTSFQNPKRTSGEFDLLHRMHLNVGVKVLSWVSISGGPVLNLLTTHHFDKETNFPTHFPEQKGFVTKNTGPLFTRMWVGYSFGINF